MNRQEISFTIYRKEMLSKLTKWRFLAFLFLVILIYKSFSSETLIEREYIAQISINGFISDDEYRDERLEEIAKNPKISALIVKIDSPGGSFVGGEKLFKNLRKIATKKPVVAILGEQATSAAYLAAIGADFIITNAGSLTGSIGVLLQAFEATELAQKIGIKPIILKSSEFKASPHPAEKLTSKQAVYLQDVITKSKQIFLDIVQSRRKSLTKEQLYEIGLGKIYLGEEAIKLNLVDKVGDVDDAKIWLAKKGVKSDLEIKKISLEPEENSLKNLFNFTDLNKLESHLATKLLAIY